MTSQGSASTRFQRALATRNLLIIRAAAAELPQIRLKDAARICEVVREREPHRFDVMAVRWIWRFCREHQGATIQDVALAAEAFLLMGSEPERALGMLHALCESRS